MSVSQPLSQNFYSLLVEPKALTHYSSVLQLACPKTALQTLAQLVASSSVWDRVPGALLIARASPCPVLAVVGCFGATEEAWLLAQARGLNRACATLRYIDYGQAERDCAQLAALLVERFGRQQVSQFRFKAIPRGGAIVLGMLAYTLGLDRAQLEEPHPPDAPLVVVDDCALTGARFGRFLNNCESQQVIFAHLYSHPDLRTAIEAQEPRVIACLSAQDLRDHGPERMGSEYPAWRERWQSRLKGPRYWIGQPGHVCFAWNEPDRPVWNPISEQVESGWRIVPPEMCLKNRLAAGAAPIPVQMQPEGKGPLKPAGRVVFGDLGEQILVGNLETGKSFSLTDVAADMWRAIVEHGNLNDAAGALLNRYDTDEATLQADLIAFVDNLLNRGLLEQDEIR